MSYINDFQQSFLEVADLKGIDRKGLSNALSESKDLVVYDLSYERMFVSANARISASDEPTLFEIVEQANTNGLLDEFEYQSLIQLGEKVKASYEGLVSDDELKNFIFGLKDEWLAQGYTVNSQNGQVMGFTLAISLSSLEWWENNSDAGLIQDSNGRVSVLPLWAAYDISGGIIGGAVAAIGQYVLYGSISWDTVGWSALAGAVNASTGAAGKVGLWLTRVFVR